jgi:hypothetical protein
MPNDPQAGEAFIRVVGKRERPPEGVVPSAEARAAMTTMAAYSMRAPKGVFIYASHEEANRDWEAWRQEAMRENSRVKSG